jgi:hypothetical protein
MYDFGKVTENYVVNTWAQYGTGEQLRYGFAAWLAEEMNKDDEPPLSELVMAAILKHFPQCTSLRGCSGCPPWEGLAAAATQPVEEKLMWLSCTFAPWPDPENLEERTGTRRRYRMVGVRSDGAVFSDTAFVSLLELNCMSERDRRELLIKVERLLRAYLDRQYLNAPADGGLTI